MARKYHFINVIIFFIFLLGGCIENPEKISGIIVVDTEGGGDFSTIQQAIDYAPNGTIIYVKNGVYYENLVMSKSISIIGENISTTIIDGNFNGSVIEITSGAQCNISGFTIQNSGLLDEPEYDAGIKVFSNGNHLSNIQLNNNNYGVILWYINNNIINNTEFVSNTRCGLFQFLCDELLITDNIFYDNVLALRIKGSYDNTIRNNIFLENTEGIHLCCGSRLNRIFLNSFINNSEWHVFDESIDNSWDNGGYGNYWDDYMGSDGDLDGIGDTFYNISITASIYDRYPLISDDLV